VICSVAWGRAGAFAASPTGLATTVMALLPQCKQWCWNLTNIEKPEFWSSCTADSTGGYNDWLSTTVIPTTAPNTGKFFCPIFNFTMGSLFATSPTITCHVEEECIVEVRGSKYWVIKVKNILIFLLYSNKNRRWFYELDFLNIAYYYITLAPVPGTILFLDNIYKYI